MDAAIKAVAVPHLRGLGFKGSLSDFHRPRGDAVDVLTFQFNRHDGAFVVELDRAELWAFLDGLQVLGD